MHPDSTVLVLGGSGFLGQHVCRALVARGHRVVSASRRARWHVVDVVEVSVDLTELPPAGFVKLLTNHRPAAVVNAAGAVWGVAEQQMWRANLTLVEHLLAALRSLSWRPRLVQLGSTHEYGPLVEGSRIDSTTPSAPTSAYGRTKAAATQLVCDAVADGTVDAVVLRVSNAIGPQLPKQSLLGKVTAELIASARVRRPAELELFALTARRDFVDVRDVADAVALALDTEHDDRVINIGSGSAVSVRQLVADLIRISAIPAQVHERQGAAGPGGGAEWQEVDPSQAADVLGWRPRYSTTDSLTAMWRAASEASESTSDAEPAHRPVLSP